ncbi:hypothetical protein GY45DRAFT_877136 [Cubamyces sp. BRFM 1775]|nr:hypothetical protein GY45DRAFT_877136 [Cubamyces sp. BRFM 1775]
MVMQPSANPELKPITNTSALRPEDRISTQCPCHQRADREVRALPTRKSGRYYVPTTSGCMPDCPPRRPEQIDKLPVKSPKASPSLSQLLLWPRTPTRSGAVTRGQHVGPAESLALRRFFLHRTWPGEHARNWHGASQPPPARDPAHNASTARGQGDHTRGLLQL